MYNTKKVTNNILGKKIKRDNKSKNGWLYGYLNSGRDTTTEDTLTWKELKRRGIGALFIPEYNDTGEDRDK